MSSSGNGRRPDVPLPRTERPDAPAYLRTYIERRAREDAQPVSATPGDGHAPEADGAGEDASLPLYLRRFRARAGSAHPVSAIAPALLGEDAPTWSEAWARTSRSPELVIPPGASSDVEDGIVDVHLVRHGETQGYSVNAGLTPMGRWQAQRRGHDLSKSVRDGQAVRIVCAPSARATQTAEQFRRGVDDGVAMWGRGAPVDGPIQMQEFRNFGVWTPSGEQDITSAFREYHAVSERYERVALGDRPLWLVEIDRFYRIQNGGGDPIAFWMSVPLVNFEPPAAVVLRFLAGIAAAVQSTPDGGRVFVATHSGPIRAFATWALGHDAGEPYNVEEVRVKVRRSLREAQVTYRNRTAEVQIPAAGHWPSWWAERAHPGMPARIDVAAREPVGLLVEGRAPVPFRAPHDHAAHQSRLRGGAGHVHGPGLAAPALGPAGPREE